MSDETLLMVPLAELARLSGRSRRTIYRYMRRKGIRPEGYGVYLSVLRDKWPALYAGLQKGSITIPVCTGCGVKARCECPVCGLELRP